MTRPWPALVAMTFVACASPPTTSEVMEADADVSIEVAVEVAPEVVAPPELELPSDLTGGFVDLTEGL